MGKKTKAIMASIAVAVLGTLFFVKDARYFNLYPWCPFHFFTGLFCPGCGSLRAISALLHGDFLDALHLNVLIVAAVPFFIYACLAHVIGLKEGILLIKKTISSKFIIKTFLAVIACFFILRNIPFHPFTFLAPVSIK